MTKDVKNKANRLLAIYAAAMAVVIIIMVLTTS